MPTLKRLVGVVISTGMDRTAVVAVPRLKLHPRTRKFLKITTKYFCQDRHEICGVGDKVQIWKCAPVSKKKAFTVVDMVERHPQLEGEPFPMSRLKRHPTEHQASLSSTTASAAAAAAATPAPVSAAGAGAQPKMA